MHESAQPGIRSRHEFSAGAHYDPADVSFGPVIGLDEHAVAPAAGFDWHAHRGVHIVSVVLAGTLRHENSAGDVHVVGAGRLLVQSAGDGIRHTETNASDVKSLRFVQVTVLGDGPPGVRVATSPVEIGGVRVSVLAGEYLSSGDAALVRDAGGDTTRITAGEQRVVEGAVLVVEVANSTSETG